MSTEAQRAAQFYLNMGLRPIALMPGTKRPVDNNWPRAVVDMAYVTQRFIGEANVGLGLGQPSRNLVDVDLDSSQAVKLAEHFLPSSLAIFGRRSKPKSHWLYFIQTEDGEKIVRNRRYEVNIGRDDTRLYLEIRGDGHQTMVPPSVHPSGEAVEWNVLGNDNIPEPRAIGFPLVEVACARLAAASLLVDFYPGSGSRHEFALAAAATLFQGGWSLEEADSFLMNVVLASGDEEVADRRRAIHDTFLRSESGDVLAGWSVLRKLIPGPALNAFREWLELPAFSALRFPLTDEGNAQRMVEHFSEDIRYVTDSEMWATWGGAHWELSTGDANARMVGFSRATITKIPEEAADINDKKMMGALFKWATISGSWGRISSIPKIAKADPRIMISSAQLDSDPWTLNTQNGVLDLRSGELRPHSRDLYHTRSTSVAYEPDASASLWHSFLHRIMGGNEEMIRFLQKLMGYCLTGLVSEQVFPIFYGSGANGKSKFLEAVSGAMGGYARNSDPETFMVKRNPGISSDVARLRGSRLVTTIETSEGRSLALPLIKQVTGGDRMTARFLYANEFEFDPTFKIVMATNHKPNIPETDYGTWRRIRLVPFEVQIPVEEQQGDLGEKLRSEYEGILSWAVEGCLMWQRDGLGSPKAVEAATTSYRSDSDTIATFFDEICLLGADDDGKIYACQAMSLYNAYSSWCNRTNTRALNGKSFRERLESQGIVASHSDKGLEFIGIKPRFQDNYNPTFQVPTAGLTLGGMPSVFRTAGS